MLRFEVFLLLMLTLISLLLADLRADSLLLTGAGARNIQMIKLALSQGADLNTIDEVGRTPLIWASFHEDLPSTKSLLEGDAGVEARDAMGRMAPMRAVLTRRATVVELLLAGGANLEAVDDNGAKAAKWAQREGA